MEDCRSLIEFLRAFDEHRKADHSQASLEHRSGHSRSRRGRFWNPLSHPFCEHSPFAAIDIVVLLLVLGALGFLAIPYLKLVFHEAYELLPAASQLMVEAFYHAPTAYAAEAVVMFIAVIAAWGLISHQARKCGKPYCKGLRKAVEFDIQLETEECVKHSPPVPMDPFAPRMLELGEEQKELEAELRKMAPMNGRTVLIFRTPCGCPKGRMEVWGPKKARRIKK